IKSTDTDKTGSLIHSTSGVNATVELFLTGGSSPNLWHYVSPPVSGAIPSVFSGTLNILGFIEPDVVTNVFDGWTWFDGATANGVSGPSFSTLDVGKGYDIYYPTNQTRSFTGSLNAVNQNINLSYTNSDPLLGGYNLIGNPYPCNIDWSVIINDVGFDSNISKAIHFTRADVQVSWVNGVGNPGDVTSFIPPMQGFFVKTAANATINITSSAKTHTTHARYKSETIIPLVRLRLEDDNGKDETVVRFDNNATSSFDNNFDALKIMPKG
ncbi:unnamed protein product, partial [marine sediment metagenome]